MAKNNSKNGVVELWGHEFKKAKDGLDKGEVESFVNELMKEQEALLKRAEHLSSLTKLAEKTIVEADNVAKQVQKETEDKAKTEAKAIVSNAEEQAQKIAQEKSAEALAMAKREAEAIKENARQQAEALLEERAREIRPELSNAAKSLYGELLRQLDSLKQQITKLEEEFELKLSQSLAKTGKVDIKAAKTGNDFLELIQATDEPSQDEPDWEVEVLPPVDLTRILDIINYLDGLPEVAKTELIPQIDKPSIMVFGREPIEMIDILRTLPQVAQVTEDTTTSNGAAGKPRKAQIELSPKTAPKPSS